MLAETLQDLQDNWVTKFLCWSSWSLKLLWSWKYLRNQGSYQDNVWVFSETQWSMISARFWWALCDQFSCQDFDRIPEIAYSMKQDIGKNYKVTDITKILNWPSRSLLDDRSPRYMFFKNLWLIFDKFDVTTILKDLQDHWLYQSFGRICISVFTLWSCNDIRVNWL